MKDLNTEINTVELTPKDFDRAAALLAEAFYDNPLHVYIFPNPNNRLKAIRWMLRGNLNKNLNSRKNIGQSFALVEPKRYHRVRKIKAMAFWNPPHGDAVSFFSLVQEGLLTMPLRFGWDSFSHLFEVIEEIEIVKKQTLNDTPAWYLNNMVVAPDLRSKGIGTKILSQQLHQVVEPSGFPAVLVTQREANVRFYQRLGFEVATESLVGSGEYAFTNWCMIWTAK
ncbi:MAG: GNAT family N-acetyltransferase [Xenococcaceae cyanobacterium]